MCACTRERVLSFKVLVVVLSFVAQYSTHFVGSWPPRQAAVLPFPAAHSQGQKRERPFVGEDAQVPAEP